MLTNHSSNIRCNPDYERKYEAEVLQNSIHSAYFVVIQYKKSSEGLTQGALAHNSGKDKTQISKLLSDPSNWTLKTVADLAYGAGVEFRFFFVDRKDPSIHFMPHGMEKRTRKVKTDHSIINAIGTGGIADSLQQMQSTYAQHQVRPIRELRRALKPLVIPHAAEESEFEVNAWK